MRTGENLLFLKVFISVDAVKVPDSLIACLSSCVRFLDVNLILKALFLKFHPLSSCCCCCLDFLIFCFFAKQTLCLTLSKNVFF